MVNGFRGLSFFSKNLNLELHFLEKTERGLAYENAN